jgi:hypothetical protein
VAATLRASPLDAFFTVAVPLALPGFVTASILTFAHTVGEFGVVLMIGGNIPGITRVASVQIYDHVEAMEYMQAHRLSAVMLVFSFVVLLALYTRRPKPGRAADMAGIQARFALDWPGFTLDVDLDLPGRGVTALFGHSGSGKTTLLRCIAGLERAPKGAHRARRGLAERHALAANAPAPAGLCVPGGQPVCASVGDGQPALRLGASRLPRQQASAWISD